MTSKLRRQKHIFSLLNSRIVNEDEQLAFEPDVQSQSEDSETFDPERLISQIFHFHKSIIQHINAGLITVDLDGCITFANRAAATLLNTSVEALLDKAIGPYFVSADQAAFLLAIDAQENQQIVNWEPRIRCAGGEEIIVGLNAARFQDRANQVEGIVLLFQDLTEVHQLRNRMERMERLALMGELSAGIAHEIRNPLAGIKAATQVLEEQVAPGDLQAELMKRVIREVDKANALLKEFFKFARPAQPKPGRCELPKLVQNVRFLLDVQLKQKSMLLETRFSNQIPDIFADEQQVEQVLLNLFLNAMDAIEANGNIIVTAKSKRDFVQLIIEDNGPGIEPEALSKIFNPFYTTKSNGVGLGLAICSRLIEENNGTIDVDSQLGKGSRFTISWPRSDKQEN